MSIRDLTYFFLWSSACVIRSIADCFSSFIRPSVYPSVRLLGMVNSCIIAHTLFTLSSWKWGCRLQEPTLFKPTPNFDHPLLIHSSYSSGHYQRLNFISFCALLLQTSTPFFSVLCVPQCIPTHIHSRSTFPHHFNWIFSFPFPLPFWTNDLFCHEGGYFCCLSLHFLLSQVPFLPCVRWIMETNSHRYHFRHFGFWLHGWTDWWINTWKV